MWENILFRKEWHQDREIWFGNSDSVAISQIFVIINVLSVFTRERALKGILYVVQP